MKRILIAPLDWGLGHATRCIPIIKVLLNKGCRVIVAGSGTSLELLKKEFPSLLFFDLPAYNPAYPNKNGSMVLKMALQIPKFLNSIYSEHKHLEKLIVSLQIDFVISDNRYGCWSHLVPCVFITHQSNILMPRRFGWLSPMVRAANERQMKKFTVCWLPDFPNKHSLAGNLISFGNKVNLNVDFIGALSRFKPSVQKEIKFDVVAICSGPEPQRSILETLLQKQLSRSKLRYLLVRGIISSASVALEHSKETVDFLTTEQLQTVMDQSSLVIARSGYSTIMDLTALGKKAIFIPTPGQTEQEYLAVRLKEKRIAFSMPQEVFDLELALKESLKYTGFSLSYSSDELIVNALNRFIRV